MITSICHQIQIQITETVEFVVIYLRHISLQQLSIIFEFLQHTHSDLLMIKGYLTIFLIEFFCCPKISGLNMMNCRF